MHNVVKAIAIGLVCATAGCSNTYTQVDEVKLWGGGSDEQKLAIAEAVSNELLDGPLGTHIMQSVPGVSVDDLAAGLALQWEKTTFTGAKTGSEVVIRCKYESNRSDERMAKIVAACKQLVSAAVKKRYEEKSGS